MPRLLALTGLSCCLIALTSCATARRHFIPREDVRAQSLCGWPAAQYILTIDSQNAGEAKVWSEGAFDGDVDGDERTILHIGFEVENRTGGELTFDVDQCRVVDVQCDEGRIANLGANEESGKLQVAAGQVGLMDFEFVLPRNIEPRDLNAFRVEWTLSTPGGAYAQSTPFRIDSQRYYRPRSYYYDYNPWWGFGTGFAVGHVSSRFWFGPHWHRWCW